MLNPAGVPSRLLDRFVPGRHVARITRERDALAAERADLIARTTPLETERDALVVRRRALQTEIGVRLGKRIQSRDGFEKTKGTPSLMVSNGAWQRIWAATVELQGGRDAVRDVTHDPVETERFVASHKIPFTATTAEADFVAHTFRDRVALVEMRAGGSASIDAEGTITLSGAGDMSQIEDIAEASSRLGASIPAPYVQVGWVLGDDGPAVVRIDAAPDAIAFVDHDTDRVLGDLHARTRQDPARARRTRLARQCCSRWKLTSRGPNDEPAREGRRAESGDEEAARRHRDARADPRAAAQDQAVAGRPDRRAGVGRHPADRCRRRSPHRPERAVAAARGPLAQTQLPAGGRPRAPFHRAGDRPLPQERCP
ncbi:hypothetical protein ACHMWU_22975 [Aeromicrobium sp. UC242_57]